MLNKPKIGVVIAAAGSSTRLAGPVPKQWRTLGGMTLVERSWRSFTPSALGDAGQKSSVSAIVLSVHADCESMARDVFAGRSPDTHVVVGGSSRTQSVLRGMDALPDDVEIIAVHDAARPFWPRSRWDQLVDSARTADGAVLAVPIADTIKRDDGERCVTVDRQHLWMAQTPQVFRADILRRAHAQAIAEDRTGTDDAELVERAGGRIALIESASTNLKITTEEDWRMAETVTGDRTAVGMRVGIGYDAHRLGGNCPLVIGGVTLADDGGLIGHSDGDVLLHAICDALLGAAALGDIGKHFSPDQSEFAGIDSRILLRKTSDILADSGYRPQQVDAVVIAEAPRLAPFVDAMCGHIASDLGIDRHSVSIKATTTESMGFVGRREGIAAQAIATIVSAGM